MANKLEQRAGEEYINMFSGANGETYNNLSEFSKRNPDAVPYRIKPIGRKTKIAGLVLAGALAVGAGVGVRTYFIAGHEALKLFIYNPLEAIFTTDSKD